MKKSLLALAVTSMLGSMANAQTNVTLGGIIQTDIKNYKISKTTRAVQNELRVDDDLTSRFWLTGSEDLGGGLSAIFYIQNRLNTDVPSTVGNGNGLANGDTWVGLKGSFGQVTLGKHTMMDGQGSPVEFGSNGVPSIPNSLIASKTVLGYVGNQSLTATRVNNSVMYRSPNFNGFTFNAGIGASGSNGNEGTYTAGNSRYADGKAMFLTGNYTNGPVYVNLAYWKAEAEGRPIAVTTGTADQEEVRLSASYAFANGFKVGTQFDRATLENVGRNAAGIGGVDRTRTAWQLPVSYTFGKNTILGSYIKANDFSGTSDSGAKMWVIGYDYAFTKRTNLGLYYSRLANDANANYNFNGNGSSSNGSVMLNGEAASILALSIMHRF